MNKMDLRCLCVALVSFLLPLQSAAQLQPKREFRGAWIQCVNNQFNGIGRDRMQSDLTHQLDELQKTGINAILFQVRPEGDALYQSSLEPWSRYLTGQQGRAPQPYWDPLAWMVEECHKRGMECHAWINPYRARTAGTTAMAANHYAALHPERCFQYGKLLIFDPGIPENRHFVCHVTADIVRRYDIDGLHIDDYFYPYPEAGVPIPDDATWQRYGAQGDRGDWRRQNVNLLIREMHDSIQANKPWVKFGVSPFGIYRNQRNDPNGSATNGTQNYDDLYADILLWVREGWIDYNIPQVYWEVGHKVADYETLVKWWAEHASGRPLYIGQDVEKTVKYADTRNPQVHQVYQKYDLQRSFPAIQGSCQWYAKACVENPANYTTVLRQRYHQYPALQPLMPWIDKKAPGKVKGVKPVSIDGKRILFWTPPKAKKEMDRAIQYVVYRFDKGEKVDVGNPSHIVAITRNSFYELPAALPAKSVYVVTALDHMQNESKPVKKTVK